jgi:hypothetical protein
MMENPTEIDWLVVSHMNFIFHFIYGMSSLPLTNSIIFQDGCFTTNQLDNSVEKLPFFVDFQHRFPLITIDYY